MSLRRPDRDRPDRSAGGVIWTVAFLVLAGLTVWRFEMWPTPPAAEPEAVTEISPAFADPVEDLGEAVALDGPDPFAAFAEFDPPPPTRVAPAELVAPPLAAPSLPDARDLADAVDAAPVSVASLPTERLPTADDTPATRTYPPSPFGPVTHADETAAPRAKAAAVAPKSVDEMPRETDPFFSEESSGWRVVTAPPVVRPEPTPPFVESPSAATPAVAAGDRTAAVEEASTETPAVTSAPYLVVGPGTRSGAEASDVVPASAVAKPRPRVSVIGPSVASIATKPVARAETNATLFSAQRAAAERLSDAGEFAAAHEILSRVYWAFPERRGSLWVAIERTAAVVHFTAGTPEPSSLSATIDLSARTVTVHTGPNRSYVRAYPCGLGPDAAALSGTYRVGLADDAGGTVRLPLVEPAGVWGKTSRLAIAATDDPTAIGGPAAAGCVVLGAYDASDLASLLAKGASVTVVP